MSTETTRRAIVSGLAVAPLAAPAVCVAAIEVSPLLARIETHKAAHAAFINAIEALEDAETDLVAPFALAPNFLTGGGYEMSKIAIDECCEGLAREYERARAGLALLASVAPDKAEAARAELDVKERENLAAVHNAYEAYEQREEFARVRKAQERWNETNTFEEDAALALCAYPCATLEEARVKAAYILEAGDTFDTDDCREALLRSFLPDADATA